MQRDRLCHDPQVAVQRLEPRVQLIEAVARRIFDGRLWIQKVFKRSLHDHAFTHPWALGCGLKLFMEPFGKTYSYLASC